MWACSCGHTVRIQIALAPKSVLAPAPALYPLRRRPSPPLVAPHLARVKEGEGARRATIAPSRRRNPLRHPSLASSSSRLAPLRLATVPTSSSFASKKWSKGKVNNAVLFDQVTYDKLITEVPKYKQISPSVLSEHLRVASTTRQLKHFEELNKVPKGDAQSPKLLASGNQWKQVVVLIAFVNRWHAYLCSLLLYECFEMDRIRIRIGDWAWVFCAGTH